MLTPAVVRVARPSPAGGAGWAEQMLLAGPTPGLDELACCTVSVAAGRSRHPAPGDGEQIILVLDGALRMGDATLERGQFAFLPAGMPHTLTAHGAAPASYIAIAWRDRDPTRRSTLAFTRFDASGDGPLGPKEHPWGVRQRQCDAATRHLAALRSHVSLMSPGAGYEPHADPYDVVIITLDGEVETLGQPVAPRHVIVYPSGSIHGMRNPGTVPARYVVFELHSHRITDHLPRPSLAARLTDPRRWARQLARLRRSRS
ncbi:MAG: hypothetical protein AB7P99_17855 [Vicinamibacterales bacterium]